MSSKLIQVYISFLIFSFIGILSVHAQVDLLAAMVNACESSPLTEGTQEFLILGTTQDINPNLLEINYGSNSDCTTNQVFNGPISNVPTVINLLNSLAGCTAFQASTNPIPAGSIILIVDPLFNANAYNNWSSYCGSNVFVLFYNSPAPGGVYANGAVTRFFCVSYNGTLIGTYSYTNTAPTPEGAVAFWSSPGNTVTQSTNCNTALPCVPPSFNTPSDLSVCSSYTLPNITGTNLSGNQGYFSSPNGGGTPYNSGDIITTTTTFYIYDPSITCSPNESFIVTITPAPTANTASITGCLVNGSVTFDLTSLNPTISGGAGTVNFFLDPGGTLPIGNPSMYTVTSATVIYASVTVGTCTSSLVAITLNTTPETTLTAPAEITGTICATSGTITLPNPLQGIDGAWSGTGVSGNIFDPSISGGNTTLTFTPVAGSCAGATDFPVTITAPITPTFTPPGPLCQTADPINLPLSSQNSINGTWSGPGVSMNQFNPDGQSGTVTLTFTPTSGQCAIVTTIEITVNTAITPTFPPGSIPTDLCAASGPINLPNISNEGITGVWSGPNVTGGPPYTFNPTGLQGATELVFTAGGCTQVVSVVIGIQPAITPTFNPIPPLCENAAPINLPINSTNTPSISGDWTGNGVSGGSLFNPLGLNGVQVLTFTPSGGCTNSTTINITVNPAPNPTAGFTGPLCEGNTLELTSNGGITYAWSGPNGFTSNDPNPQITNITTANAGTYTVTVTSADGCTGTASVFVPISQGISINTSSTDITCNGDNNGSINISISGIPSPPINITWSAPPTAPNPTLGNITNLPPGTYSITIIDGNGCNATASITIFEPSALNLECNVLNHESSVGSNDGVIGVSVSGGNPNYSIAINPPNAAPYNNVPAGIYPFGGLSPGTYSITVTDDNGCTNTCSRVINSADCDDLTLSIIEALDPSCNSVSDGSITVASAGSGDLTYFWTLNNQPLGISGSTATGLGPGMYTIIVTDINGCDSDPLFIQLSEPDPIDLTCMVLSSSSGPDIPDGSVQISIANGFGNMTANLIGPTTLFNLILNNGINIIEDLLSGDYVIEIIDANGCQVDCAFTIGQDDNCDLNIELVILQNVICRDGEDGAIQVIINGGSGNFTFEWSDGQTTNGNGLTNLQAGVYSVTVVDNVIANCTVESNIVVLNNPQELVINCIAEDVSDSSTEDGRIVVEVIGGVPNHMVQLFRNNLTLGINNLVGNGFSFFNNLGPGIYLVVVTDANGCSRTCSATINVPGCTLQASLTPIGLLCANDQSGAIELSIDGAIGDVSIVWTVSPEPIPDGTINPMNLSAGNYTVVVTDQNNCTAMVSTIVSSPSELEFFNCAGIPANEGESNGSLIINFDGGTPGYTINYAGPMSGSATFASGGVYTISDLPAGEYIIGVTDENGCSASCTTTIGVITDCDLSLTCELLSGATSPENNDAIVRLVINPTPIVITLTVIDPNNQTTTLENIPIVEATGYNVPNLQNGPYRFIITNPIDGCMDSCTITIPEFEACDLALQLIESQDILCFGQSTGSIEIGITGSFSGDLSITWLSSPVPGLEPRLGLFTDLPSGVYSLSVSDESGCSDEISITLNAPLVPISLTCNTINNGTAVRLSWTGTFGGIIYDISSNGSTVLTNMTLIVASFIDITTLAPGTYDVIITDENGCVSEVCTFVILSSECTMTAMVTQTNFIQCHGDATASLSVTVSNGLAPFNFNWSAPVTIGNTGQPMNLPAGNYNVTITDSEDCEFEISISITQPDPLIVVDCREDSASENGLNNGTGSISIQGGTAPYSINRQGPNSSEGTESSQPAEVIFGSLEPGVHTFTVEDANGCISSCQLVITELNPPCEIRLVTSTLIDPTCNENTDGTISITVQSDNPNSIPFTFNWSNNSSGAAIENLQSGLYTVTVVDAVGCDTIFSFTLNDPLPLNVLFDLEQPTCVEPNPILQILGIDNGTAPYSVTTPNEPNQLINTIPATLLLNETINGDFGFTVTDANGCRIDLNGFVEAVNPLVITNTVNNITLNGSVPITIGPIQTNRTNDSLSYQFFFNGESLCDSCSSALTFTPISSGSILVQVSDQNGCIDQITFNIEIIEAPTINRVFIPNAFSPNGDGVNDTFLPFSNASISRIKSFEIFDRWGDVMYQFKEVPFIDAVGWDGTRNSVQLDPGTYIYAIEVEFTDGFKRFYSGEVNLIR